MDQGFIVFLVAFALGMVSCVFMDIILPINIKYRALAVNATGFVVAAIVSFGWNYFV